jgi:hypothetical protein
MKYPQFAVTERTPHIVDGMIADIAWREQSTSLRYTKEPSSSYGKFVADLCVSIDSQANTPLIFPKLSQNPTLPQRLYRRQFDLIRARHDGGQLAIAQHKLHETVISGLKRAVDNRDRSQQVRGRLAELVTLGLHSRYAHPGVLAYQALQHHERDDDIDSHFDVGVILRNPDFTTDSHFLQVKTNCLGRCGRPVTKEAESHLGNYRPIVQFVSACCDLDLGRKGADTNVPELLVGEFFDQVNSDDVNRLDNLTDQLLLNMTTNLLPRGTRQGNGFQFPADHPVYG